MRRRRVATTIVAGVIAGGVAGYMLTPSHSKDYVFPDKTLHPGAINVNVTQANINQTICVKGWTATIRPPVSYTNDLKIKQMKMEKLPGNPSSYEEDHLISLELGGSPTSPQNLWPEPWENKGEKIANMGSGAESKDKIENKLRAEVCSGTIALATAQAEIANNWQTAK